MEKTAFPNSVPMSCFASIGWASSLDNAERKEIGIFFIKSAFKVYMMYPKGNNYVYLSVI